MIRAASLWIVMLVAAPRLLLAAPPDPVVLLLDGQRREVLPVVRSDAELLPLEPVIEGLGVTLRSDPSGASATLSYQRHEAVIYNRKSLASVGGELRLLSAPALYESGRWLVPVDGLPRVLGGLLGRNVEWRPASRVLIVGNVSVPRLALSTFVSGEAVRVVIEASEKVPFRVLQEEARVTVTVPRDLVDVSFTEERLTGGIVERVQFLGGRENLFAMPLGRRFHQLKAYELDGPTRLVLEFQAQPLPARADKPPVAPAPETAPAPERALRTVVIDPGHGGAEVGARGPGGTFEKDVTLAIARKLRAALANSLGLQVFLTRDKDQELPLDERTAIANNYKADLFISIHANASRLLGVNGSEVYFLSYQATDDESRRVAMAEGLAPQVPAVGTSSDLALILWDMAQAQYLEESSALASRMQEELSHVTGSEGRGVKQAPFRVLVGAAMPAVLVETAFISNPDEEKLLGSDAHQNKIVAALLRGVSRYEADRQRRLGLASGAARPGS